MSKKFDSKSIAAAFLSQEKEISSPPSQSEEDSQHQQIDTVSSRKKLTTFQMPEELDKKLTRLVYERKLQGLKASKTQIILDALDKYLNQTDN